MVQNFDQTNVWNNEIGPIFDALREACEKNGIPLLIYAETAYDEQGIQVSASVNTADRGASPIMAAFNHVLSEANNVGVAASLRKAADLVDMMDARKSLHDMMMGGEDNPLADLFGRLGGMALGMRDTSDQPKEEHKETYEDCVKCPVLAICSKGQRIVDAGPQPKNEAPAEHDPRSEDKGIVGPLPSMPQSFMDLFGKMFEDDNVDADSNSDTDNRDNR